MVNSINWQNIIHLSTEKSLFGKLFSDVYPVVVAACIDLNEGMKKYNTIRYDYIEKAKGYLKSEEMGEKIIIDTICKDANGFRCIPKYEVFIDNLNKFYKFIESSFSPTINPYTYLNDIISFRDTLFRGNKNVVKAKDIISDIEDLDKYFNYLVSPIEIYMIKDLAPNFPVLTKYDGRILYPKLIKMISDYLSKKELLEFFTRVFDATGQRDIFISTEDLDTFNEYDTEMLYGFEDITHESLLYMSLEESDEIGGAIEKSDKNGFFKLFEKLKNRIQSIPAQITTLKKKADLFFSKRKNIKLYKRTLGKIPSLYKRYGSETMIDESVMKGDPVEILTTKATSYIINMGKHVGEISDQLLNMMNSISNASSYESVKSIINKWVDDSPVKTKDGELSENKDKIATRMRKATRAKLVECIVAENDIYGYTPESMVLKKFPPPNHTIVSLFVENPFERPSAQPVTEIFKSPESFEIMANSDKRKIFSISELQNAVLRNKINAETFKDIERRRNEVMKKMKQGVYIHKENEDDDDTNKENERLLKEALKGCKLSIKEVAQMKIYVMDCINIYFSMVLRIDKLCIASINAMLLTEKKHSDSNYNMGKPAEALRGKGDGVNQGFSRFSEAGRTAKKVNKRTDTFNDNYGGN